MRLHQAFPKSHRKIRVVDRHRALCYYPSLYFLQHEILYILYTHTHTLTYTHLSTQPTSAATHAWLICTVPLFLIQINKLNKKNSKSVQSIFVNNVYHALFRHKPVFLCCSIGNLVSIKSLSKGKAVVCNPNMGLKVQGERASKHGLLKIPAFRSNIVKNKMDVCFLSVETSRWSNSK